MVVVSHLSSYHAELLGPAGVAIFFVLSGYLITALLLKEQDRWGAISLPAFYLRRALRLFPALLLIVVLAPVLLWAAHDPRLGSIVAGLATTVFYLQDFASATAHFGVLPHAWSLSVEEQYYLIWPVTFGVILSRVRGNAQQIARIVLAITAFAGLWHLIAIGFLDYNWTYYAPDTNAVFLLAGCALATSLRAYPRLRVDTPAAASALIAVCVLPLALTRIPGSDWRESTLLMFPVALAGALVVLGAGQLPVLNLGVLRWFGKISYGLYLWNYLLISLEPNGADLTGKQRLMAGALAIVVAAASWYLIESPILRQKLRFQRVPDVLDDDVRAPAAEPALGEPTADESLPESSIPTNPKGIRINPAGGLTDP
jgi:peptidoglycan/LPS O-acetylase OafA/YrhL